VTEREQLAMNEHVDGEHGSELEERPDRPDEAARWRMLQMVDEYGNIPEGALVNAWEYKKQMPVASRAWPFRSPEADAGKGEMHVAGIGRTGWTWLGPGNIGGRIRSIVVSPTNPSTMWVGSVGGGIWKTTDGGATWAPLDDFMANLAVSTIAIDPNNPNILYAGTGEGFYNGDALRGAGVFKTTDGGTTWTQLSSTANSDNWRWVNRIAISPPRNGQLTGQVILAATRSGIWRSTDGGVTWSQSSPVMDTMDVNFNPGILDRCVASGNGFALYSVNNGLTWQPATGLPTGGRIEVAYFARPSIPGQGPELVYASADVNNGEVYRSANGGQSYTRMSTGYNYLKDPQSTIGQGFYDNIIWVDPTNSNIVIVGGIDLWRSTDAGQHFTQISNWRDSSQPHSDHHIIVESPQFNGTTNKTVFFGNDGGIYRTNDVYAASTAGGYTELNNNLGITQFYGGAGNTTSGRIIGGAQDNGTLRYNGGTETWTMPSTGDGGFCAADPLDQNFMYDEYIYLTIHRSTNGGAAFNYVGSGIADANNESTANFIAPFILDPNNPNTMLAGGASLWRSNDIKETILGPNWRVIKQPTGSLISAVAVAKGNSNIIWVGYNNGDVYVTTDGTSDSPSWTKADSPIVGAVLPNRYCTRITIDPTNSGRVYVTFGGFTPDNVWRTDNRGSSWTSVTGNLPNAPVRTIAVWQQNPNNLYVGTEVGVFASANAGQTWSASNDGPTNCSVDELFWMANKLVSVTHGRGMFSININTGQPPSVNVTTPANGATFTSPANISLAATASDPDGSISKVEFFANGTLIATLNAAPYTTTWTNVPAGTYALTAIATDNSGNATGSGTVNITVGGSGGTGNNNFANPSALSGSSGNVTGNNVGANKEAGEPAHAGNVGGASLWYQWQAPASGSVSFTTAGSGFDTLLAVYTGGAVNGLTTVGSNDDVGTFDQTSIVTFNAVANTTYRIAVDGFNGATGNVELNWHGNNFFADAQAINGGSGTVNGNNFGATKEAGEPAHAGNDGGVSVWYRWQAPVTGAVTFSTSGSNFDTLLAAYTGGSAGALTTVANNDDESYPTVLTSKITFNAVAGTTYRIAVDGFDSAAGYITLSWNQGNAGSNVQLGASTFGVNESARKVLINVTRTGSTGAAASVDYATSDGTADRRKDYTQTLGTLNFAAGETSKTVTVFVADDSFQEAAETFTFALSNAAGTTLGSPASAVVTITSNDATTGLNPVDVAGFNAGFYVGQHYVDFLNREADAPGLAFWTNEITSCGANAQCAEVKKINVSGAFFLSIEFQNTGYLVERIYKSAYGDATSPGVAGTVPVIRLEEFLPDTLRIGQGIIVGQGNWQAQIEANKQAFALEFVTRQRFLTAFPTSMTPAQFVDKLRQNTGAALSQADRDTLVAQLTANNTTAGRAAALRSVAEDAELQQAEKNRAFVLMQYYGYLRRNPNDAPEPTLNFAGWKFWLDKLNQFGGDFVRAEMVKAFITSSEYKQRFGP
jgi:hypothetical protein